MEGELFKTYETCRVFEEVVQGSAQQAKASLLEDWSRKMNSGAITLKNGLQKVIEVCRKLLKRI